MVYHIEDLEGTEMVDLTILIKNWFKSRHAAGIAADVIFLAMLIGTFGVELLANLGLLSLIPIVGAVALLVGLLSGGYIWATERAFKSEEFRDSLQRWLTAWFGEQICEQVIAHALKNGNPEKVKKNCFVLSRSERVLTGVKSRVKGRFAKNTFDLHSSRYRYQLGAVGDLAVAEKKARSRTSHRHSQTASTGGSGDNSDGGDGDGGDGDGGDGSDEPQAEKKYVVDPEKEKQFLEYQFNNPELLIKVDGVKTGKEKAYLVNLSGFFKNPREFYKEIIQKPWYDDHVLQIACRLTRHKLSKPDLFSKTHDGVLNQIINGLYSKHRRLIERYVKHKGVIKEDRDNVSNGLLDLVIVRFAEKHDFFTQPNPDIMFWITPFTHDANQALVESGTGGDTDAYRLRRLGAYKNISDIEKEVLTARRDNALYKLSLTVEDEDKESADEVLFGNIAIGEYTWAAHSYEQHLENLDQSADEEQRLALLDSLPEIVALKECLMHTASQIPPTGRGVGSSTMLRSLYDRGYFKHFNNVKIFPEIVKSGYLKKLCAEFGIEQKAKTDSDFSKNLRAAAKRFAAQNDKISKIVFLSLEYGAGRVDLDSLMQALETMLAPAVEIVVDWGVTDEEAQRIKKEASESLQSFVDALVDALSSAPDDNTSADTLAESPSAGAADTHPAEVAVALAPAVPSHTLPPMEPPFVWMGGKRKIAAKINEILPPPTASQAYIEPFAGGLAVLLSRKPAGIEVANDADGEIINFFKVLRDNGEELQDYLRCMPYSRALFDALKIPPTEPPPPLERAAQFFYLARSAFGGEVRGRVPRWAFAKAHDSKPRSMFNTIENDLLLVRDRLRLVYFESSPALDVIRRYDSENAVFYCDPPYIPDTRRDGNYAFEMSVSDHEDLLLTLLDVKGAVALSGYPSDLYADLLCDWEYIDISYSCKINNNHSMSDESRQRTERVWMNPRLADDYYRRSKQQFLFDFDEPDPPIQQPPPQWSPAPQMELVL